MPGFHRGPGSTQKNWNTAHLVDKLRREKPLCRVCGTPCDPDEAPVHMIFVPLDDQGDEQGMIPVHSDGTGPGGRNCASEAEGRLRLAQGVVNARRDEVSDPNPRLLPYMDGKDDGAQGTGE